jgi:hypothetical protein
LEPWKYVVCFGLGAENFPLYHQRPFDGDDKATLLRKEQQARSLRFVTAARARDPLVLIYSGDTSTLLNMLRV